MILLRQKLYSKTSLDKIESKKDKTIVPVIGINKAKEAAKKAADKADSEGKSDIEIIIESKAAGEDAGKKIGTGIGLGVGTVETVRGLKKISRAIKMAEENPEKIKDLGRKGIKLIKENIPGEATEEVIIKPGKEIAKKILKNPKKYGRAAGVITIAGGGLTIASSRALGKTIGKRSAERNAVSRLENRYNMDNNKKKENKNTK